MTDKIIPIPDKKRHVCDLGGAAWAVRTYGYKSLHRCGVCKKWSFPVYNDAGSGWLRVRWFNFRMRSKIRNVERKNR